MREAAAAAGEGDVVEEREEWRLRRRRSWWWVGKGDRQGSIVLRNRTILTSQKQKTGQKTTQCY